MPLCGNAYKVSVTDLPFCVIGLIGILLIGSLRSPPPKGGSPSPARRLYGFSRQRRYKKWRRKRRTSPAQRYYITPEGESPQPVREASADPGQNPGSPGPKGPAAGSTLTPVRACQPSGIPESTAPVPIPTAPKGAIDLATPFCGKISPLRFAPVEMTMSRPPTVPVPIPTAPKGA